MAIDLIEHNPLLKHSVLYILDSVRNDPEASRVEIEARAQAVFEGQTSFPQTPTTIVDILLRNGALTETIIVNGEPYDGSLEDIQMDTEIEDDAVIEQYLSLADIGSELLVEYGGDKKLRELFASKPQYTDVFTKILEACVTPEGCSRAELEQIIDAMPQLAPDERGQKNIYPQYFIDSLETVDGIVWQGSWHTTETGRTVMS